jgi:hypothetical protein
MKSAFTIYMIIINALCFGAFAAKTHASNKLTLQINYEKHPPGYISKSKSSFPEELYNNKISITPPNLIKNSYGGISSPKLRKHYKLISSLQEKKNQSFDLIKATKHKNITYKFSLIKLPLPMISNSLSSNILRNKTINKS